MSKEPVSPQPVIVFPPSRGHTTVNANIAINRAPTDESVKLLREMETKAKDEVVKSLHVGNTIFECIVQQYLDNFNDQVVISAVFKLNGKRMRAEHRMYTREAQDKAKLAQGLRDEMAKIIATEVLLPAFSAMDRF